MQLSPLVLLASVFFSGFVVPVDEFRPGGQLLAHLLPVTYGIQLLQGGMLRRITGPTWQLAALAGMTATYGIAGWALLRRPIARAWRKPDSHHDPSGPPRRRTLSVSMPHDVRRTTTHGGPEDGRR